MSCTVPPALQCSTELHRRLAKFSSSGTPAVLALVPFQINRRPRLQEINKRMPLLGLYRDFITPISQPEETWCWLWLVFQLKKTESIPLHQACTHILHCFPKHICKDFIFLERPNVVQFYFYCHKFLIGTQTWFSMWLLDMAILQNSSIGSRRFYGKSLGVFWRQPEPRQRGLVFLLSPLGMPFALSALGAGREKV